jgi:glyoxylase I family protein
MRLHHVAVGARDVETLAAFYGRVFELPEVRRFQYADGRLRSVWLKSEDLIVMIERSESSRSVSEAGRAGPFLLAFEVSPERHRAVERSLESAGAPIESRTEFTSYARDPEGNRVAISHFRVTLS